jgi:hypothetical protein
LHCCGRVVVDALWAMAEQWQTKGQTERTNQQIEQYPHMFVNYRQDDWVEWVSLAGLCYNDTIHTAMKQTLFYLNYGQHPHMDILNK